MMSCDKSKLKEIMFEVISDETGIAGLPIPIVERRMQNQITELNLQCEINDIRQIIQRSLDEWEIDKTLDEVSYEMMREMGLAEKSEFIWHLKALSKEKAEFYKSLKPEAKALIRLLREQDDPEHRGEIPREFAIKKLADQGYSKDAVRYAHVEDTIEDFYTSWGDERSVRTLGLVKEYEKTEEYKQWQEEMTEKSIEKEMRRYRFTEECETTSPIYERLDEITDKRWHDLEVLENKRGKMDEKEYLRRMRAIETRDADEETKWNQIIKMVYKLPLDILIKLRKMLRERLPTPESVFEFLDKKSKEKKDS
jgi:hypothetical protein